VQFRGYKLVYRRYAHLYFMMCIDVNDNELAALEAIHLFVEILDHYFGQVTELDIVLSFHQVWPLQITSICLRSAVTVNNGPVRDSEPSAQIVTCRVCNTTTRHGRPGDQFELVPYTSAMATPMHRASNVHATHGVVQLQLYLVPLARTLLGRCPCANRLVNLRSRRCCSSHKEALPVQLNLSQDKVPSVFRSTQSSTLATVAAQQRNAPA
jgi:hypothetical protein